jgi:hypothetical protein
VDNVLDPQGVDALVATTMFLEDKLPMQVEVITPSVVVAVTFLVPIIHLRLIKADIMLVVTMLVKAPRLLYAVLDAVSHVEAVAEVAKDAAVLVVKLTWEIIALRLFLKRLLQLLLTPKFITKMIPMMMNIAIIIPTKSLLPKFIGWMNSTISITKRNNITERKNMNIDNQHQPAAAFSIAMKPLLIITLM